MKELVVMVPSDDGKEIHPGHPGDSSTFYIYLLKEDKTFESIKIIKNEAEDMEEEGEHGSKAKMKKVLKLLGKVDVILSRRNSPNMINIAKNTEIQPIVVRNVRTIEEGLKKLLERFDEVYKRVEKRRQGERFDVMLM
ncbi:MAG: hypothetical protein J7L34_08075 [Thermotogaceae bacterium]|nr:hypothetical protein [Thermotogaceae bacterium]